MLEINCGEEISEKKIKGTIVALLGQYSPSVVEDVMFEGLKNIGCTRQRIRDHIQDVSRSPEPYLDIVREAYHLQQQYGLCI